MKKAKSLRIEVILDRSGSMVSIWDDTIGGFNSYLEALQKDKNSKKALLRLTQFDTQGIDKFGPDKVTEVKPLTRETFIPRAGTPLYDALGAVLADPIKEDAVTVVVITDGQENSSREWTSDKVKAKIKELTDTGKYTFIYLGANQDAWSVGGALGFGASASYSATPGGTASAYAGAAMTTNYATHNSTAGLKVDLSDVKSMLDKTVRNDEKSNTPRMDKQP